MPTKQTGKLKSIVITSIRTLPPTQLREVLDFVLFLKTKGRIDPSQAYFWTKQWQTMERSAQKDKKLGRITGDGTFSGLLKVLHR